MNTHCPASVRLLLAQWAHISSFYHTVGLHPSFTYTVGTTRAIYCTQTAQPHFLYYLHSGPIPPHFMTQWAYTPSFTYTVGTTRAIYCTQIAQPLFLYYLHSGPIPPHFMTQWAYTPHFLTQWAPHSLSTVPSPHLMDTHCPASVPPLVAE